MDQLSLQLPTSRLCDHLSLDDFVFLNPTGVSLDPDDTRTNFFLHIGLQESIYRHRLIYRKMKAEARAGMDRLFSTRMSLQADLVGNPHVLPPYNLVQITESAFQQEIQKIYQESSKQTRGIYDIIGGSNGNWAIRWMLWRVIQNRLAEEAQETSNRARITYSRPSTTCSSSTKSSLTGPLTPYTNSTSYTITSSLDYSDSEAWDDVETKINIIKEERDITFGKRTNRSQRSFWEDVMNT